MPMQKHIQHNKDKRTQFFREIYLSLYLKGFERVTKGIIVWEVSWRLNWTATYWPPLSWPLQCFFPVLLGCSTGGLGHGSHSSIFSPTDVNFLSLGLYNNLMPTYLLRASQFALNSTRRQSRSPPWYPRPDVPVIYTSAFLLLIAWPGSICNRSLFIILVWKLSDPAKQKSSTRTSIISCSLFPKYYINIGWSYFEATTPDLINSSLNVKYQDLEALIKPFTHFESF